MSFDPVKHHRQSIRLKDYDYSQVGMYFVTVCALNRECLFGEIVDGGMRLNEYGKVVRDEWLKTSELRPNIRLDEFVVMPNHFHGIVDIVEIRESGRGVLQYAPTMKSPSQTVGAIVRGFKSTVTKQINGLRNLPGQPIWQRSYYEHIIRDEGSLGRIRAYIVNNPARWEFDEENPG